MQALFFENSDYLIEVLTEEFLGLHESRLETSLRHAYEGTDMGKVVSLELMENEGFDGIELIRLPKNAKSWEEIQRIKVKINNRAYQYVIERGIFGTRYNADAKIDIQIVPEYTE